MNKYTKQDALKSSLEYFDGDEIASDVFVNKYALRDKDGSYYELTPDDMHKRLAKEFARIELKYPNPMSEEEIYESFNRFDKIVCQGSPSFGIGNPYQIVSLSNCYVVDSPLDSYGGILYTDQQISHIYRRRGGAGINLSNIRPKGLSTNNAARSTDGIGLFMERYSNTTMEVAQCIAKGQRVLTKDGLKNIENITDKDAVWTKKGFINVSKTLSNGSKKTFRLQTNDGFSIRTSEDHIFLTEENGVCIEKRLKDFNIGDPIVLIPGTHVKQNSPISLIQDEYVKKSFSNKSNRLNEDVILPTTMTNDLAYLTGYMYGDGYVEFDKFDEPKTIEVACSHDHPEVEKKICKITESLFGYKPSVKNGDGAVNKVGIYSKVICNWFKANKILKEKAENIKIPQIITDASSDIQLSFLAGFFDADGYTGKGKKGYVFSTVSLPFAEGIQTILMANGIISKIEAEDRTKQGWRTLYSVSVRGKYSQKILMDYLSNGIFDSAKIYEKFIAKRDNHLTPFKAKPLGIKSYNYKYISDGYISANAYMRLQEEGTITDNILIKSSVKSITEEDEIDTFDLVLPEEHLFWCEGFYVHNSGRRGALMMVISCHHYELETFIDIKNDPKKVNGANISIQLSDVFMEAVEKDEYYTQQFPVDSDTPIISKQVRARDVWAKIIHNAHKSAEPGLLNWDTVLRYSPADIYEKEGFKTVATNPCLTGDTRVATQFGLVRIDELAKSESLLNVSVDNRIDKKGLGVTIKPSTKAMMTSANEEVFLVETKNGYSFKATAYHKVPTTEGIVELKDLKIGDKLLTQSGKGQFGTEGSEEIGTVIGWIEGNGSFCYSVDDVFLDFWGQQKYLADMMLPWCHEISKDETYTNGHRTTFGITYANKHDKCRISSPVLGRAIKKLGYTKNTRVPEIVWKGTKDCVRGYIRGLFAADGHIEYAPMPKQSFSIRLTQIHKALLEDIQILLSNFGISSKIYDRKEEGYKMMPDGNGGFKEYLCQKQYCLDISSTSAARFEKEIGFMLSTNQAVFDSWKASWTRGPYKDSFTSEVTKIQSIGVEPVYCLTQPDNNTFIANGLATGNCAELPLCVKDSCRLIAMNLWGFIKNPFTEHSYFDYDSFAEYTQKAQRLMDDLIDLELECLDKIIAKVESDPEPQHIKQIELDLWYGIKDKCINGRRTGLGITALGDVLAGLNVRYGSLESVEITSKIYKTLAINAYKSSAIMAGERGTFPIYNYNKEVGHPFIERLLKEDKELYDLYRRNGKRNIALLTTAPTGSISIMLKTTSGLEPAFLVEYNRSRKLSSDELKTITPDRVDALGIPWKNYTIYHHKYKMWMDITGKTKYEESPYYKAMSNDVDWVSHVDIQAAGQYWVDHSISKTINIPKDSTKELVATIYSYAWKKGLKGVTIYRDGCRDGVLNSVEQKKEEDTEIKTNNAIKRPKELPCDIHFTQFKGNKYIALVGLLKDKPYEVFFGSLDKIKISTKSTTGKIQKKTKGKYNLILEDGSVIENIVQELDNTEMATISRLTSLSMRHGVGLEYILDQLDKDGFVNDFNKVLARVVKKYIPNNKRAVGAICPECGSDNVRYVEGCKLCSGCGYSKC